MRVNGTGVVLVLAFVALIGGSYWYSQRADATGPIVQPIGEDDTVVDPTASLQPSSEPASGANELTGQGTVPTEEAQAVTHFATGVTLQTLKVDTALAESKRARLEITVREGQSGTALVNRPVRIEPIVFRPGRAAAQETRTDTEGRVTLEVEAGERLRVLVFEEFRNVPMVEQRAGKIVAGTVARMEISVPLPPMVEMWAHVVDGATGASVPGARVWLERLIKIGDERVLEILIDERADRKGLIRLQWPDQPPIGGRAEFEGVGETRFVPVKNRGTEETPFEVRLGPIVDRGDYGAGRR